MSNIGITSDILLYFKGFKRFNYVKHSNYVWRNTIKLPHGKKIFRAVFRFKAAVFKKDLSLSVSRVLSCTVIYLRLPSPISSSDVHGIPSDGQPYWRKPNLATGGVYIAYLVTKISVSSYLAFPSLQGNALRFISVALSLKSPSPDVIRHPVLCCSDFPHSQKTPRPYNRLKSILLYHFF